MNDSRNDTREIISILVRLPKSDVEQMDARLAPNQSRQDVLRVIVKDFGRGRIAITEPTAVLTAPANGDMEAA